MPTSRALVYACVHAQTYKYSVDPDAVVATWRALEARFGPVRHHERVGIRSIECPAFLIRSVASGNPITVVCRRRCRPDDLVRLHGALGYEDGDEAA